MSRSGIGWLLDSPWPRADGALRASAVQPAATLEAMRVDGLVASLGAGLYLPADSSCSLASRAEAFASLVPGWAVLGMEAAAWVHGGPLPSPPFVLLAGEPIGPGGVGEGLRVVETPVLPGEVARVGGLRLTEPTRTAVDIARWGDGALAREAFRWLVSGPTSVRDVRSVVLAQSRFPHNRKARDRLRALQRGLDDAGLWGLRAAVGSPLGSVGPAARGPVRPGTTRPARSSSGRRDDR